MYAGEPRCHPPRQQLLGNTPPLLVRLRLRLTCGGTTRTSSAWAGQRADTQVQPLRRLLLQLHLVAGGAGWSTRGYVCACSCATRAHGAPQGLGAMRSLAPCTWDPGTPHSQCRPSARTCNISKSGPSSGTAAGPGRSCSSMRVTAPLPPAQRTQQRTGARGQRHHIQC